MITNHEDDEFVAVRVQDPRIQNEGSWNSYIDYKIFLHTNSKAFTAKTSCVRRRYSEFEWLKKKLQKNAGLVPVPDLPGKSFFFFNNETFLEKRRRGLQAFLDKVLHTTVCLSDSQLHLFLQTQLPVGHIQDCVQGLTPYSVTDAILTYASSNRGLAQAQQEDSIREPSLTVSYESMESPAPHQPSLQPNTTINSKPAPGGDSDPLEDISELCEQKPDETQHRGHASIRISQKSNQLEAVVEEYGSTQASFYLGEIQDDSASLSPAEQSCVIQTPVEVHSPMGTGYEDSYEGDSVFEDNTEERKKSESEICVDFDDVLAVKDNNEEVVESHAASENLSEACKGHLADVKPDNETESESKESDESGDKEETPLQSIIHEESWNVISEPEVDLSDSRHQMQQEETENEDSHSLPSSNESIIRCSEEESLGEETEDSMQVKSPDVSNWSEVEGSSSNIFYINGGNEDKEDAQNWEVEDQQYTTKSKSPEPKSAAADVDLTENGDFSILETIRQSGVDDGKFTKQEASALIPLEGSEEV
ncbi:sorting nexin-11 [Girardinichthys multiradiatus]|uniref:sorting nexin-11 n=1 Tax=Girardinichthys multiradiatus TaxID=208333 RepID=UPI001FACB819|nr:sorting nexin-11 [Girardinichthys multiradiatus]XP_047233996.1 sorting nexin-11 [Girardinichthys multiradiatus]